MIQVLALIVTVLTGLLLASLLMTVFRALGGRLLPGWWT